MTGSSGELDVSDGTGDPGPDPRSDRTVATETPVAHSTIARVSKFWLTGALAVSVLVLLLAFVVDTDPVVRFGFGAIVFALWMWWFVSTGVAILGE